MTTIKNNGVAKHSTEISFRTEQEEAVNYTVRCFQRNRKMLWNAKMRFGKTLCALEVARKCNYQRTLILTHRPTVRYEWFDALKKLNLIGWGYGCKNITECNDTNYYIAKSVEELEEGCHNSNDFHYVYFVSMQDLRGSKRINPTKGTEKNDVVFSTKWDLLIVDEAHEGIQTKLGQDVINELQKKRNLRTLYLSGTPYNIQSLFGTTEVYHWDYSMEQKAKESWKELHPHEPNPYEGLAKMHIVTYNLARNLRKYRLTESGGFNFAEFFRVDDSDGITDNLRFKHEEDVKSFLRMIGTAGDNTIYPYNNKRFAGCTNHTLWYVPSVRAAYCLAKLLSEKTAGNTFADYHIVNVAGNISQANERLDITEITRKENDALMRVRKAVKEHDKTITLSCGRLTMGVSVPEWTSVLMLAGAETGGARYFQTIFRCQSPYTGGNIKKECFAFDFSPRRTLTVIDQYINSNSVGPGKEEHAEKLSEFLHYCSLTEYNGSRQTTFDTEKFVTEVNKAYSESLIRNGFRDACLYGNLDNLRKQDVKLLDEVAEAISQGISNDRQQNREKLTPKARKKRSVGDKTTKGNAESKSGMSRLTPRQRAIAILSQISMRFPMMIYGTVEKIDGLTLDSFMREIDQESWNEFMPKGVSMKLFNRIRHFYREDIFVATAKAIVNRLHKADQLPISERVNEIADILSDFCYPDRETVLTPWRMVNHQLANTVGGYCFLDEKFEKSITEPRFVYNADITERVLMNPKSRILDICSKTGLYSLYMAFSMYKLQSSQSQGLFDMLTNEEAEALWRNIVENNIFAICKTNMARRITMRTLVGFRDIKANIRVISDLTSEVIVYKRKFIRTVSDGKNFWKTNNSEKMKFDAIIGNPPYQVNIGELKDNYGIPLYNQFVDVAREMQPNFISMIMPSRWFTGGRGLDGFRQSMLSDKRIRSICDFVDSKDCFPTVDISGGIDYFLWDAKHKKECEFTNTLHGVSNTRKRKLDEFPIFVRNNNALSLIYKVMEKSKCMLNEQVSGQTPFGFVTTYRGDKEPATDGSTVLLKSSGSPSYVRREEIKKNAHWTDLYKVVFSKATCEHAGTPDRNGQYRVLSSVSVLEPGTICTQSYLVGGVYDNAEEAQNLLKYLYTKFVRYLMLQTITSQDLSPEKFIFVPIQDFTSGSDINWQTDIDDINRQLYKKYDITDEELNVVENTIKPL